VFIEFPAGKLDPGEAELVTARREYSRRRYEAGAWTPLGTIHTLISYTNEKIDLYLAEGLVHVGARLDDGEFLEVITLGVDEMLAALDRGEITDAKTITALLLYVRRLARGR
jgi:ADP-ribose pyrophosphatase